MCSAASSTVPPPRRRGLRLSWLVWVGIVLVAVGGGLYLGLTRGTTEIYVADTDLPAYHQLTHDDLDLKSIDRRKVPSDGVRQSGRDELLGRYTTRAVKQGEPLRTGSCGPRLRVGSIATAVIALPWTVETSLGGKLSKGDQVKVLLSPNEKPASVTGSTVDALVLDLIDGSSVVLAVKPADVAIFAAHRGSSTLSLARVATYAGF